MSAAYGGALKCKIRGIERTRVDPPMMMPAMSVHSYATAVSCGNALEHDVLVLDRTHVSLQTKNAIETANQAKNEKQNKMKKNFR